MKTPEEIKEMGAEPRTIDNGRYNVIKLEMDRSNHLEISQTGNDGKKSVILCNNLTGLLNNISAMSHEIVKKQVAAYESNRVEEEERAELARLQSKYPELAAANLTKQKE